MPSPHHAEMTFDDLPTLQDAFRTCDRDLLVRVVMADQVQGSFPAETVGKKQRHAMEKRILTSLDAMCSLKVKRKGGKRRLLLYPEESFSLDGRTGMIKRRLSASLFDLRHIESVKKAREALGSYAYAYKQVKRISKDKRKRAIVEAEELEPQAYTLVPWEKVLAYRIWLPGSLCLRERYMVLASAFWEMTFYGFEYDRAQARAANAKAERLMAESGKQLHILFHHVVMVAGRSGYLKAWIRRQLFLLIVPVAGMDIVPFDLMSGGGASP